MPVFIGEKVKYSKRTSPIHIMEGRVLVLPDEGSESDIGIVIAVGPDEMVFEDAVVKVVINGKEHIILTDDQICSREG